MQKCEKLDFQMSELLSDANRVKRRNKNTIKITRNIVMLNTCY